MKSIQNLSKNKIFLYLFFLLFIFLNESCTNQKATSSLLTSLTVCSDIDCPPVQSKIDGTLSIEADQGNYQLNVDKGDMIEISGKCSDLAIRKNQILVQVFESEDTSTLPYIDNATDVNCLNNMTTATPNATPSIIGQRCFWINQGKGVVDNGLEYPQCFNGRFSFSVRLGRIIRQSDTGTVDDVANPRKKYLVRYKLRTNDGVINESGWNSATIDRGLTKPSFSLTTDFNNYDYSCNIHVNPFKNEVDPYPFPVGTRSITSFGYSAMMTREYTIPAVAGGPTATAPSIIFPLTAMNYPIVSNVSISDWKTYDIIPGVKQKVVVTAYDTKYTYPSYTPAGAIESVNSDEQICPYYNRAQQSIPGKIDCSCTNGVITNTTTPCAKQCHFSLSPLPPNTYPLGGRWEWAVIKNQASWPENFTPQPVSIVGSALGTDFTLTCGYSSILDCTSASTANGDYYGAARFVLPSGEKGAWSNAGKCTLNQ